MPNTVWAMIPDPITKINVIFTDDQNTGSWIMRGEVRQSGEAEILRETTEAAACP